MAATVDYGLDDPKRVRTYAIRAAMLLAFAVAVYFVNLQDAPRQGAAISGISALTGIGFAGAAWWLYRSSKTGKLKLRDEMIAALDLKGDEKVLDIGAGRGLLAIAAARKLKSGKVTAVDLWRPEDLSGNSMDALKANAQAEGVKIDTKNADPRKLPFKDASFDVVLSSYALHRLDSQSQRELALREIARVLKPGGKAAIFDVHHAGEYAAVLQMLRLQVTRGDRRWLWCAPGEILRAAK